MSISVVDEAVRPQGGGTDDLGIKLHAKALHQFIEMCDTPITIGIQGEWGSGKTSLLNFIVEDFSHNPEIKQIWINSWEYSLLSSSKESLLKIINKIMLEILAANPNKNRSDKIRHGAATIFKGALRIGTNIALGAEAAAIAQETMSELSSGETVTELREQISLAVKEMADSTLNPYKKIVIYVDDLDRIEPKNAVEILELLKNIFSIPNCVFVLAIDYQVIVKGLAEKFGAPTPENEWEFKAFFDKIIQLPFMMPLGQYDIGNYVNALLKKINFADGDDFDSESLSNIVSYTIGGNPRSIKRLANSASLILLFAKIKDESLKDLLNDSTEFTFPNDLDEKMLLFSILCLQIAYPKIYALLVKKPQFDKWDEKFAFEVTKKAEESKSTFTQEFENAMQTYDFDEEWEKALFRICYLNPGLKARSADISQFLSFIKDEIFANYPDFIGQGVSAVLSKTSVTSVTSDNEVQTQQKVPARKALSGGLAEFAEAKGYDNNKKSLLRDFINQIKENDPSLQEKFTKTQISFSNNEAKSRAKRVFCIYSVSDSDFMLNFASQKDKEFLEKMFSKLPRSKFGGKINIGLYGVVFTIPLHYSGHEFSNFIECISMYKKQFQSN